VLGSEPGERNEPANLMVAATAISELKGMPLDDVMEALAENGRRLYGI